MAQEAGRILIVKIPKGEAPLSIRAQWAGCELPCKFRTSADDLTTALTETSEPPESGYAVDQAEALKALALRSPLTADWWRKLGYPRAGKDFFFRLDEAAEVVPVPHRTLMVADDMETGTFELPGR